MNDYESEMKTGGQREDRGIKVSSEMGVCVRLARGFHSPPPEGPRQPHHPLRSGALWERTVIVTSATGRAAIV